MGQAVIASQTLPAFLTSMHAGLAAYAVYSCLGVILSYSRGRRGVG
jgi:hypothetical protein